MKLILLVLALGIGCSVYAEDYRLFTGKDGRAIEAKIVKADPRTGKVTVLRLDSRRSITVPATVFSKADQAYIKEWMTAQDFLSNSKLRISIKKKKGKSGKSAETKKAKPPCSYEIELQNRSGTSFQNLTVEYCMYMTKESMGGKETLTTKSDEWIQISLGEKERQTKTTQTVELFRYYTSQVETTYYYNGSYDTSVSYNKVAEDNLEGIRIRVHYTSPSGTRFTREICEPSSIENEYAWGAR